MHDDVETLNAMFLARVASPDAHCLRAKVGGRWVDISSDEVRRGVEELARGLAELGVARGTRVAILAENRPQWLIADYAILALGAVVVPVYATLIPSQIAYILADSESLGVIVSTRAQAEKVGAIRADCPALGFVVAMDSDARDGDRVLRWDDVTRRGRTLLADDPALVERAARAVGSADLATLIYTSGTTGEPKGVMLTHGNLMSNVTAVTRLARFVGDDVALSFLPLSHVFERMADFGYFAAGATIAYAESIDRVPDNMLEVRPTLVASVPRLYEKMYARVLERGRTSGAVGRAIFTWAVDVARRYAREVMAGRSPGFALAFARRVADRLVYSKVRARTGGRLKFFISGGAPLAKDIAELFFGMGITILEGYGLSETSPVISVNTPEAVRLGTVGKPIPEVEVRIASDGEILVRGPNVMKGYFRKERETAEVFDGDWFKTGDIGHLDSDGFLVITDRKKDLFKTSGAKYVAPQPIESRLKGDDIVAQAVLIGNGRRFVAALLVPNPDSVRRRLPGAALPAENTALVADPRVRELFDRHVTTVNESLSQFEKIKRFELLPDEFTLEDGTLTPTLKVKRKAVDERFAAIIDRLYEEG